MKKIQLLFITAALSFSTLSAQVILVQYNFENPAGTTTTTSAATTEAGTITSSTFGGTSGLNFSTFASDTPQRSVFENTTVTSIAADTGPYWDFTITANSGTINDLNLDELSFAIGRAGSGSFSGLYNVSSSADNHQTLLFGSNLSYGASNNQMSAPENQTLDVSSLDFDSDTSANFRIYYASTSSNSNNGARLDTVTLTTVIPEPSVYATLAGLTGLGLVIIRHRRRVAFNS